MIAGCAIASVVCDSALTYETSSAKELIYDLASALETPRSLFEPKEQALDELYALLEERASELETDNAYTMTSPATLDNAELLIRMMPDSIPMPEIAIEDDGDITFDWMKSRYCMLSASVGESARIAYAWLDGTDRGHSVTSMDTDTFPSRLYQDISRIMGTYHAALRSA